MLAWIEDAPDKKGNEEVWGLQKGRKMGFNSLFTWVKVQDDKKNAPIKKKSVVPVPQ